MRRWSLRNKEEINKTYLFISRLPPRVVEGRWFDDSLFELDVDSPNVEGRFTVPRMARGMLSLIDEGTI